jgi:hypothetical protein
MTNTTVPTMKSMQTTSQPTANIQGQRARATPLRTTLALSITSALLTLSGCGVLQVANNGSDVNQALSSGKAVLISRVGTFNPTSDISESITLSGSYRPPLTYWVHRQTQKPFILGARDSDDGKGKVLTTSHYYYVMEPGFYDLVGYVKKERLGSLDNLARATTPIKSSIGFVNYSKTTLPTFYTYQAWVPPRQTGTTFDGRTLTQWYSPGYYQERGAYRPTSGIFVDMRGLVANAGDGSSNIGTFFLEPGKIMIAPDFKMDFTNGPCDTPAEGQWVCPLTSLTMSAAFTPQHDEVRKLMAQFTYKADLIKQVDTAYLLPGNFFKTQKMELDTSSTTTLGQPYGRFRVTLNSMPKAAAPAAK